MTEEKGRGESSDPPSGPPQDPLMQPPRGPTWGGGTTREQGPETRITMTPRGLRDIRPIRGTGGHVDLSVQHPSSTGGGRLHQHQRQRPLRLLRVLRLECWMCWMDWLDVLSWRLQLQLLAASRSSALRKLEYSGVSAAAGAQQSGSVCTEKINISGG